MFNERDIQQFEAKGISQAQVNQQIKYFKEGFPYTKVTKAATIGDGLLKFSESEQQLYVAAYETNSPQLKVFKFVPASGAASRMFKDLFAFVEAAKDHPDQAQLIQEEEHKVAKTAIEGIRQFAFFHALKESIADSGLSIDQLLADKQYATILTYLLTVEGLNYGNLPKGLLQFHEYDATTRTPVEEHFMEGGKYCKASDGSVLLHFTVSPEHQSRFEALVAEKKATYDHLLGVTIQTSFSQQQPYTDTIAVDMEDQPFRLEDGSILFRPGGHGALIENLNQLDADFVFIKNVDNVVPDRLKDQTYHYKRVIGGVLVQLQKLIFGYLGKLDAVESEALISAIEKFYQEQLSTVFPPTYHQLGLQEKAAYLRNKLNRPIRVCGMVKNEGEPGGGPFWTENPDETVSLQIVESAQFDPEDETQMELLKTSSHFNPVDIVCSLKNYKGEKFDLLKHVNHQQGFIANKSKSGRSLKALELPGLWNGSMSDWNTVFVEVPVVTFNPVKKVTDLLRPSHQK